MAIAEKSTNTPPPPAGDAGIVGRSFDFAADTFAFANELVWAYRLDPATRRMTFHRREPKPTYTHRCFVVVRSVRQFFFHAEFDAQLTKATADDYRALIRAVIRRPMHRPSARGQRIVIPGFSSLREFSFQHPEWLKAGCGGAWQSYVLRSHWRMVLPISREHQKTTAGRLVTRVRQNIAPVIHLVQFPALTINHGMVLYHVAETATGFDFMAYDPNDPSQPARLSFDAAKNTFFLPANSYWPGGELNVIEIYRSWWM
jgi:hypothetical protein